MLTLWDSDNVIHTVFLVSYDAFVVEYDSYEGQGQRRNNWKTDIVDCFHGF